MNGQGPNLNSFYSLIFDHREANGFESRTVGGAASSFVHRSWPSIKRRYRSLLSPATCSIVNAPNLELPEGMYLEIEGQ